MLKLVTVANPEASHDHVMFFVREVIQDYIEYITKLKIITLSQVWQFVVIDSCIDIAHPRYPTRT